MRNLLALSIFTALLAYAYSRSIRTNSGSVSISFFATDLKKCGLIFACDTSVTVLCSSVGSDWKPCEKTRIIRNNNNPIWPEIFTFEHEPSTRQRWRFDVKEHSLLTSKVMGSFMVNVDEYVEGNSERIEYSIPNDRGTLTQERRENPSS